MYRLPTRGTGQREEKPMFGNLVESGSHTRDIKRKSTFFIGTLIFYSVLLSAAGVGSIYAYNARIDDREDLEILALMRFPTTSAREPERQQPARSTSPTRNQNFVKREVISVITPYGAGKEIAPAHVREVSPRIVVIKGRDDGNDNIAFTDVVAVGPPGFGRPTGGDKGGVVVEDDGEIVPEVKTPKTEPPAQERPKVLKLTSSLIQSKAISKPVPPYPDLAKRIGAHGTVAVQVLIDERGHVVSAQATSGHAMLQKAATDAALRARFTPTLLGGQPVKVSGVIFYNFVLN